MINKKYLAAKILKISPHKVKFADNALEDIEKALTRSDIRGLIAMNKITKKRVNEHSRARARKNATQKKKGKRKGKGSRKGNQFSIISRKDRWISRVRIQRKFLKQLRDKKLISSTNYQLVYNKIKSGFFRNKRHIKLYLNEYNLLEKKNN
ncbi:50S ribosomal protein L19e [Candidatus Woesearchaeota archaeon]|nr:50S ribosomal protein L19e [Candidatus Woesearchaeota archaeon]